MERPEELGAGSGQGLASSEPTGRTHSLYITGGGGWSQDSQGAPRFRVLPAVETAKQSCLPPGTLGGVRNYSSGPAPYPLRQNTRGSLCTVFTPVQPVCSRVCTTNIRTHLILFIVLQSQV